MYKSALILGALAIFVAAGATIVSPVCAPCAVLFLGLGAGYLACVFDKPMGRNIATRTGAIAGATGGAGAVLGQAIGTAINGFVMGPAGAQQFNKGLGLPSSGIGFEKGYWFGLFGGAICLGLLDVLLMAAFGALGAFLWWQIVGRKGMPAVTPQAI